MDIWLVIFVAGIGTYAMRSVGVWLSPQWLQTRWLDHLPFAVILVMATHSLLGLAETPPETIAVILASGAVIAASFRQLPLVICIAIGCVVFGMAQSISGR